MSTHDKIMEHFSVYMGEQEKFEHKNVKAAASRARIANSDSKTCKSKKSRNTKKNIN